MAAIFEPWYASPASEIDPKEPLNTEWGYLIIEEDGSFRYDGRERPSDEEILASNAYLSLVGAGTLEPA